MELYYKDLISEGASLEALVDDLARVVQGADELVQAVGRDLPEDQKVELKTRLERLKQACQGLSQRAVDGARAADRVMRLYPYSSLAVVFSVGMIAGALLNRRR
jgi:ElaB/YqjD/DUF883 family membrane-anchored ribosome-binding protein